MQYFNAAAFALAANATTACQEARPQGLPSCVTRFFAIFFLLAGQDRDSLGHSKKDCWIGYLVTEITTDLVFGTLLIIIIMSWGKEWKCAVSCISSCSRAPAEATVYYEGHHEITLHEQNDQIKSRNTGDTSNFHELDGSAIFTNWMDQQFIVEIRLQVTQCSFSA